MSISSPDRDEKESLVLQLDIICMSSNTKWQLAGDDHKSHAPGQLWTILGNTEGNLWIF